MWLNLWDGTPMEASAIADLRRGRPLDQIMRRTRLTEGQLIRLYERYLEFRRQERQDPERRKLLREASLDMIDVLLETYTPQAADGNCRATALVGMLQKMKDHMTKEYHEIDREEEQGRPDDQKNQALGLQMQAFEDAGGILPFESEEEIARIAAGDA